MSSVHSRVQCSRWQAALRSTGPCCFPKSNPFLAYIGTARPAIYLALFWTFKALLFTTPLMLFAGITSAIYIHLSVDMSSIYGGSLPPYPREDGRDRLFAVLGEVHHQLDREPSNNPQWLMVPDKGLFTGIAVFGSIGSGKTQAVILPLMRQLFGHRANDETEKLSGLVLEVKGDLCRQLRMILSGCNRQNDFVEVSLHARWRYNPLHNDLDPYALAYNIASLLTNIWGRGKEPFWQQSYTDLVKYIIILHKVLFDYVTLFDVYTTAISPTKFERLLIEAGIQFSECAWIVIEKDAYKQISDLLKAFHFELDPELNSLRAKYLLELEQLLTTATDVDTTVYEPQQASPRKRELFEAVDRWYWEHWKHLRPDIKTSVVQGIAVFLSLFDTDPDVKRVFCPPKELYEGVASRADPDSIVMPPFAELIEQGKICGLNFPVALNPGLAKAIGTMMKQDYPRAVLLRIPKMDENPNQYFRPTVFLCDEYQNFATVGSNDPNGDERFLSLSRQPKCIPIIATQSINSIREALPGNGFKTLLQAFRTKIFLATSDPDTARYASDLCGRTEKTRVNYSFSESSNDAHIGVLTGRATSNRSSVSASKTYQRQKDVLFDDKAFYELKNAQSLNLPKQFISLALTRLLRMPRGN